MLVTAQIAGGTGPSSTFNFNGGSLSNYNVAAINYFVGGPAPYFMYNLKNAYVYPGGAFIDDGGANITINQALQAPSGFGLATITVTNGGANYFAPPSVAITGGSGTGATASSVISGGKVTAINVTSPGSGYASGEKLTITLTGGGGSGAGATNNALVANGSGGLTYASQNGSGAGTLKLIAPATYTNATVIKSGTLQIGVGGSISNSAILAISNNATLDSGPAGGMNVTGQLLKGFGNISGPLTANAGAMIYPGSDPVIGTLTFGSGGLNMAFGSAATFNLSTTSGGANDQIVINGNSSTLLFANNTIHIKAPNVSSSLDTSTPYVLIQNNSFNNPVGLPNVTPVFDVAPANAGVGHWLIQPSGKNIVLLNSVNSPPGGTASVTVGAVNGTNIVRNTTITLSAQISGPNPIQSVSVDLSAFGGTVTQLSLQGGNWTGQVTVPAGTPPGSIGLPIIAYDGTLYGEVTLALNVLTTTDTWSGAHFNTSPNSDDNANWVGGAAPGYLGDTVIFAGNTGLTPVFDQNYTFNGIGFASGAGPFVLTSSGNSIGVVGGITNNSATTETVAFPMTLNGMAMNAAAGNLVLSNTLTGPGLLNVVAGPGGVTMNGTDGHSGNTLIASGGTLTIGPSGIWQDPTTFNPSYVGSISNSGTFNYSATSDQTIAGVISGSGAVFVNGPGALTLSGNNSFTGNLTISNATVHDTVAQNANAPTVSGLGNPQNGKTNIINSGGILMLESAGGNEFGNGATTPAMKFVVNQGGMIQITSGNATMGPVTLNGGTLSIAATASTQYAPYELQSLTVGGTSPSYISPTNNLSGNSSGINLTINAGANAQMPINVASTGSGGPDLFISAVMINSGNSQNAAGFVKTGNGVMEMSAVNIFTGPINVGAGAVLLDGGGLIASGIYSNNMVISNGASFIYASTLVQTNMGVLSGAGTLVVSNAPGSGLVLGGTNTFTGTLAIKTGTLSLIPNGSISNVATVSISRGGTFDLTQLPSPYVWPATSSVTAGGSASSPALINTAGGVTFGASSAFILNYNDTNSAPQPALNIAGNLSLGGNAFTVNTADGQPLADGTYVVVQASGSITSGGSYPAVTGTAIGGGHQGAISVVGQQVILTVSTATVLPPATITVSRTGSTMNISWPSDHLGYILQSNSINVAIPADWFNVPGSSTVTNFPVTIQPGQSNVFFRLVSP
jgi:autotransporter-associated beta strand protein